MFKCCLSFLSNYKQVLRTHELKQSLHIVAKLLNYPAIRLISHRFNRKYRLHNYTAEKDRNVLLFREVDCLTINYSKSFKRVLRLLGNRNETIPNGISYVCSSHSTHARIWVSQAINIGVNSPYRSASYRE
jgi:hypothetical protein